MKIERPTYLIDREVCVKNIRDMKARADRSGVRFRPHFKTHQSRTIGRWFREAGIDRITVSSVSAANWFAGDGWTDITIAFTVNLNEIEAINDLAGRIRLGLLVEDLRVARKLAGSLTNPVDVYLKIDTGYHRTGMDPSDSTGIRELVDYLNANQCFRIKGLLTHAGHTYHARSVGDIRRIYAESTGLLQAVRQDLGDLGNGMILSWGDTPSCSIMENFPGIDEIRPGNFVFYDLMQWKAGVCSPGQIAGVVACPVVAVHPGRNQAVLYGGAVHLSKDSLELSGQRIFGQLTFLTGEGWTDPVEGAYLTSLSQEHGILEAPSNVISKLRPGDSVGVIPVHSCLTAHAIGGYQVLGSVKAEYFTGI